MYWHGSARAMHTNPVKQVMNRPLPSRIKCQIQYISAKNINKAVSTNEESLCALRHIRIRAESHSNLNSQASI
jgi:hypothetical protein